MVYSSLQMGMQKVFDLKIFSLLFDMIRLQNSAKYFRINYTHISKIAFFEKHVLITTFVKTDSNFENI